MPRGRLGGIEPVVFLFLSLTASGVRAQQLPRVYVDIDPVFARHAIEVAGYLSPDFPSSFARLAGDSATVISKLRLYTLILKNTAGLAISEVTIRCPKIDTKGRTIQDAMTNVVAPTSIPLEEIVLTPEPGISMVMNSPGKSNMTTQMLQQLVELTYMRFDPSRYSQVTVSLDSVLFIDGGMVGPDRAGMLELKKAEDASDLQMAASLEDTSITDEQITKLLTQLSSATAITGMDKINVGEFALPEYQSAVAGMLLQIIRTKGRAQTAQWYRAVLANRPAASMLHRLD